MSKRVDTPAVRVLPEDVANKIAAGEVVERPASVVKELVENALDAKATRIVVRVVAAGRRTIEVADNGHGMGRQDALLSIERHATSKVRKAADLDSISTLGFRGEALASIAAVSRFELLTRREKDEAATRLRIDGGILRDVTETAGPVGTRVTVNRLYFNTPARAKFLKGITTELSHCLDVVQRHALSAKAVGFQFYHNEKLLVDVPANASLRERVALIWGLNYVQQMVEFSGELGSFKVHGLVGTPALTRAQRSFQFFFLNGRPVVNRSLQYGFEDGYRGLLTVGRHPVGVVLMETHPRFVDVNIHPSKREIRFRDERAARDAVRDLVRERLAQVEHDKAAPAPVHRRTEPVDERVVPPPPPSTVKDNGHEEDLRRPPEAPDAEAIAEELSTLAAEREAEEQNTAVQGELLGDYAEDAVGAVAPSAVYRSMGHMGEAPMQLFDTYLLVPEDNRLLIIDQHALHERLTYDSLRGDLADQDYAAQQLTVPVLVDVPPSHAKLLESNLELFKDVGFAIEPFGGVTFQVTAVCHLYDESKVSDTIYRILDELAQGDFFDRDDFVADVLRLATEACRSSVKAGDRLTVEERQGLLDGFRRLRPPYTCPHGRPIITELTLHQMEKSFRRRQ